MKSWRVLHWLMAFVCFSACAAGISYAFGAEPEDVWTQGEVRIGPVVYCQHAKDAEELAASYVKDGEDAADLLLETKQECTFRPATFIVVKLVTAHKNGNETMNVVEVRDARGSGTYYVVNATRVVKGSTLQKRGASA